MCRLRTPFLSASSFQRCSRHFSSSSRLQTVSVSSFLPRTIRETLSLNPHLSGVSVEVFGWVRSVRAQKKITFVEVSDGSALDGLQCVVKDTELAKNLSTGTSVRLKGTLVPSPAKGQAMELKVDSVDILGDCDPSVGKCC